jgi:WD40 repeat protein
MFLTFVPWAFQRGGSRSEIELDSDLEISASNLHVDRQQFERCQCDFVSKNGQSQITFTHDVCDAPVSAHAWSNDGSLLALCPNTPDLLISKVNGSNVSELRPMLSEHRQVISRVDFTSDWRIVTCSHDRNGYVWTFDPWSNNWR